jgi:hypothetical protein
MTSRLANAPTEPRAFIAWEIRRKARYELIDGEVRMMAGGSRAHDVVAGNILAALHLALRGQSCDVHGSNLRSSRRSAWSPIQTSSCAAARSPTKRSSARIPS